MSLPASVEQRLHEIVAEEIAKAIPQIVQQLAAALSGRTTPDEGGDERS